jgi:hypothetical protein
MLSPTAVHRDSRSTSLHAEPLAGGLHGTGRGACTRRLNTGPSMGSRKWMGAMRQERAEPHGQFITIDDYIARCYLNREPTWMLSRPPVRQNHTGFGVAVLNFMKELKNRPFWTAPSGLKWPCWRLFLLFNSGPTCFSLTIVKIQYGLYVLWILKFTCQVAVWEAESLVSKYVLFFLVKILLKESWHM